MSVEVETNGILELCVFFWQWESITWDRRNDNNSLNIAAEGLHSTEWCSGRNGISGRILGGNGSIWQINWVGMEQGGSYIRISTNNWMADARQSMHCRNRNDCGWLTSNLRPNGKNRGFHWLISWDKKTEKPDLKVRPITPLCFLEVFPETETNRIWESWYQRNEYVTQHKAASDQEETWAAVQCAVPHSQPQQGPSSWSMLRPFSGPPIHSSFQGHFNSWPL